MNRLKSLGAVIAVALLFASCQAMTGRTAGRNVDDAALTASVNAALVSDKPSNFTRHRRRPHQRGGGIERHCRESAAASQSRTAGFACGRREEGRK